MCFFFLFLLQQWADEILKMSYNLLALNGSVHYFLRKAYVRLTLQADKGGKIPLKTYGTNIISFLSLSFFRSLSCRCCIWLRYFPFSSHSFDVDVRAREPDMFYLCLSFLLSFVLFSSACVRACECVRI